MKGVHIEKNSVTSVEIYVNIFDIFVHINIDSRSDRIQVWDMRLRISADRPVLRYRALGSPSDVPHKLLQFLTPRPVSYLTLHRLL